jgi:hypothetical protein
VPARLLASLLVLAGLLTAADPASAAGGPGALATIPIPGGADALAAAAGLPTPAPRGTVCLEVIRRLHAASDGDGPALAERRAAVAAALEAQGSPAATDLVPLPFTPEMWITGVFARRAPTNLAHATLTAPRPAFLYYGAMGLDDETRAWFAASPSRIERMGQRAGAFAAFGPSLRIRGGRVETPGGEVAAEVWAKLVDASPADAEPFVERLFEARLGRLAWLYATIARLDAGQQKHLFAGDAKAALARVRKLADVFEKVNLEWRIADRPFWRPRVDPATFLVGLAVSPDGVLELPPPAAWASTLGSSNRVDSAWLTERVFLDDPGHARDRFELVRFAARWRTRAGDPPRAAALALFAKAPLAALVLERTGATDDALAARLLALIDGPALRKEPNAPRLLQASLALVERASLAGTVDAAAGKTLLTALFDRIDAAGIVAGTGNWLGDDLAPQARRVAPAESSWDARLAAALAGPLPANPPRVEWEGQRYTVDRPAAERERIARLQAAQGSPSLERAVIAARGAANHKPDSETSHQAAAALVEALGAFVYAAVLPGADPELLASRVDQRHDLDAGERPGPAAERRRWQLAEPLSGGGTPWHLAGSLVSMDVALAVPALRRVSDDPPSPVLPAADRIAFARTVALMGAHADDRSRDRALEIVARGRARLAGLTAAAGDALDAARAAGLSAWRREALVWSLTHDPASVPRALSTTELAWLGGPDAAAQAVLDAWGTSAIAATGELATRFPAARPWEDVVGHDASAGLAASLADLNLRVAAFLADRKLPSALARDLLSAATLELVDRVNAPRADDWRAIVDSIRAIPDTRFEDYVAALTADGPLRPVRDAETGQ